MTHDAESNHHEQPFSQDFHDDDGRLIHAVWDGSLWTLTDADTGELVGVWDGAQLPSKYDLTIPAPAYGEPLLPRLIPLLQWREAMKGLFR